MDNWLSLEYWQSLTPRHAEEKSCALIGSRYPQSQFQGVERVHYGNIENNVALFKVDSFIFVYIPGFKGVLGTEINNFYDMFSINRESKEATYLSKALTPLRTVTIAPFLIQIASSSLEERQVLPNGTIIGSGEPVRRTDVVLSLQREGYRLPTSDEWEYACGAGSRALFRWGNDIPPFTWKPVELREKGAWQEDAVPNAFGLTIAQDPYDLEYCSEPNVLRGGDGGATASVGASIIETWLPLASSYQWPLTAKFVEILRRPFLRRVLSL